MLKFCWKKKKIDRQKNWPIGFRVGFASLLSHMDGKHFSFDVMKNVLTKVKLKENKPEAEVQNILRRGHTCFPNEKIFSKSQQILHCEEGILNWRLKLAYWVSAWLASCFSGRGNLLGWGSHTQLRMIFCFWISLSTKYYMVKAKKRRNWLIESQFCWRSISVEQGISCERFAPSL